MPSATSLSRPSDLRADCASARTTHARIARGARVAAPEGLRPSRCTPPSQRSMPHRVTRSSSPASTARPFRSGPSIHEEAGAVGGCASISSSGGEAAPAPRESPEREVRDVERGLAVRDRVKRRPRSTAPGWASVSSRRSVRERPSVVDGSSSRCRRARVRGRAAPRCPLEQARELARVRRAERAPGAIRQRVLRVAHGLSRDRGAAPAPPA